MEDIPQPAPSDEVEPCAPASEGMTLTLPDVLSMLERESLQADAQQLLQDVAVLQEWQRARNPGNKVRDAMLKLGTFWDVPRKVAGKKRAPAEVAQEVEENMLKKAKKMLMDSVAQPATQSDSNPAGASAAGSIVEVPASAEAVSELSAASAARPASESMTLTLPSSFQRGMRRPGHESRASNVCCLLHGGRLPFASHRAPRDEDDGRLPEPRQNV